MPPQLLSCAYSYKYLEVLWLPKDPREHNFGLVLILSPTGCTEGCVYFPQSCRNTHLPHFLDCLLNTTLIPCLLVCCLSILHERICDYSRVQSSVTGILRMGYMNIHITWLTHVRTGPPQKKSLPGRDDSGKCATLLRMRALRHWNSAKKGLHCKRPLTFNIKRTPRTGSYPLSSPLTFLTTK